MEMEKYASSAASSSERPDLSLESFLTPGQMTWVLIYMRNPEELWAAQKKDPPPRSVECIPILVAPGVNPEFVKMSEQTLRHMQAEEDAG